MIDVYVRFELRGKDVDAAFDEVPYAEATFHQGKPTGPQLRAILDTLCQGVVEKLREMEAEAKEELGGKP